MEPENRGRGKKRLGLVFSVFLMAFVITVSLPAEAASACTLSITPNKPNFAAGESWTVDLNGCPINAQVQMCTSYPSPSGDSCTPMGTTDGVGTWSRSGTFSSSDAGAWIEYAKVGSATTSDIAFIVKPTSTPTTCQGTEVMLQELGVAKTVTASAGNTAAKTFTFILNGWDTAGTRAYLSVNNVQYTWVEGSTYMIEGVFFYLTSVDVVYTGTQEAHGTVKICMQQNQTQPPATCTLSISPAFVSLSGSGQQAITASGAVGTVSWSSSNPSIAAANPSAGPSTTVTAMGLNGTAIITATDPGVAGCSKTALVIVEAPAPVPTACEWWCGVYAAVYQIINGKGWATVCSSLSSYCGGCQSCNAENLAGGQAGVLSSASSGTSNAAATFKLFDPTIVSTGDNTMQVTLVWFKPVFSSGPEESYYIYRQDGSGQFNMVSGKLIYGQIPGDKFVDNGLRKDVEYTYYVKAYWAPPAFSGLSPKNANSNTVKAKWTETPSPASGTLYVKAAQGYDSKTGQYDNYDAYAGEYLILWGNFPASGNEVYVNGARQEVKYQSANQLNVLLSFDVVTGVRGVQVPVYVRNSGVNSNTINFYVNPSPGGARMLNNGGGSTPLVCDGECTSITATKSSCSNDIGTYNIHVVSTENNFYLCARPFGGSSCTTFTSSSEPVTTSEGSNYPTGNWVTDNMVFELRNASDSSLMKSVSVGITGCGGAAPTCTLIASNPSGPAPLSGTLTWTTANTPASCTATGGAGSWQGSKSATGGSEQYSVSQITTYGLSCTNAFGTGTCSQRILTIATPSTCILNISTPRSPSPPFFVGEQWTLNLTCSPSLKDTDVYISTMIPGNDFFIPSASSMGKINAEGKWSSTSQTFVAANVGEWKEVARVGAVDSNLITYNVQPQAPPPPSPCNLPISPLSLSFATLTSPGQQISVIGVSQGTTVSWSSSNANVASVSPNAGTTTSATVTPKSAGTATITASVSVSCFNRTSVTVNAATTIPPTYAVSFQITDSTGASKSNNAFKIGDGWKLGLTTISSVGSGKQVTICARRATTLDALSSAPWSCTPSTVVTDYYGIWSIQGTFQNAAGYTEEGSWEEYANVTVGSVQYTSNHITFSVSPATAQTTTCTLTITISPAKTTFTVGDAWTVNLTGCPINAQVQMCTKQPSASCTPMGMTDNQGRWSRNGVFSDSDAVTWTEYAIVGSATTADITFVVQRSTTPTACTLSLSPSTLSLRPGESSRLTALNAKAPVEWRTNIPSVAALSPVPETTTSVTVTAMTLNGTATITATDAAGCSNKSSVSNFIPSSLSCSPFTQTVRPGQYAVLNVVGGVPPYLWSGGGNPASGSGSTFSTSFSAAGNYPVTLRDNLGGAFSCIVQVQIPPPCSGGASDLTVTDFHLTDASGTTKTSFAAGGRIYPSVTIRNNGPNAACGSGGHFYISIYSNQPSQLTPPAGSDVNVWVYEPGAIAAGESKTYSVTANSVQWTNDPLGGGFQANSWTKSAGSYTARAFVDSYDMVSETNEGNNQATGPYAVLP